MKKYRSISIFSVLFVVILCISLFTACQKIEKIEGKQVEKIVIWAHGREEYEMTADDAARFIELYNSSKYEGEGTGEGGTPEFGIRVYFRDGAYLLVNDFGCLAKDFEVSICNANGEQKAWYYINSEALCNFVSELVDKAEKTATE